MKKLLSTILISALWQVSIAQNQANMYLSGEFNSWETNPMTYRGLGTPSWICSLQYTGTTGDNGFKFRDSQNNWDHNWGAGTGFTYSSKVTFYSGGTNGTINMTQNKYYVFIFKDVADGSNSEGIVFEADGAPVEFTSTYRIPSTVYQYQKPVVYVTLNSSLPSGYGVYVRYTTDNWSSSTVLDMTQVSGTTYKTELPPNNAGTTLKYYFFTSGAGLSISHSDADLFTITYFNNGGSNYEYTVQSATVRFTGNDGNWSDASTWEGGNKPNSTDQVVIQHNVTFDENSETTVNSLLINMNKALTISPNKRLTITSELGNNGFLSIFSDANGTGSLIHNTSGVNATVERYIEGHFGESDAGWHLLGSPVASFNISGSSFNPDTYDDLYAWDESSNLWLNYKANEFTQIEPGKGYLVAYQNTTTKSFSGTLNVSDITFSNLSYTTSQGNGWHLLGNPFASALIWNNGSWSLSNVNGTAKIWHSTNKSYSDISANGIIPQAQGIFVRVIDASNGLTIPASARTHSSQPWYKNSDVPQLRFIARPADGSSAQETIIRIEPEATIGEDPYWDSQFLAGYAPQLYSLADGVKLSTNALPSISEAMEIPLGFQKNQHNNFTIELSDNSLSAVVLLKDLKTGITHNLSQQPVYSFTADEGDDPLRFKLAFSSVGIAPAPQNTAPYVWYASQALHVNNITPNLVMEVYSSNGQSLFKQKVSTTKIPFNVAPGIYMVKLSGDTFSNTQKIVVY